jgi:hypothetical protein
MGDGRYLRKRRKRCGIGCYFNPPFLKQRWGTPCLIGEREKREIRWATRRSPGLAKPEDFTINSPDTNLDYPFGGQNGDSKRECNVLLKVREEGRPPKG